MNRGLWLASSLSLGVALVASGCYMGPHARLRPPMSNRRLPRRSRPQRRDGLSRGAAPRPDSRVPAPRAGLRLHLGRRLLGLDRLRLELGRRLLGAGGPGLPLHRPALRLPRRPPGLLPALLAGARRLPGLRLRLPRRGARGRLARATVGGTGRLARPGGSQRRVASHARRRRLARRSRGARRAWAAEPMRGSNPGFRRRRRPAGRLRPAFHPAPAPAFHPAPAPAFHAAPRRAAAAVAGRHAASSAGALRGCTARDPRP